MQSEKFSRRVKNRPELLVRAEGQSLYRGREDEIFMILSAIYLLLVSTATLCHSVQIL